MRTPAGTEAGAGPVRGAVVVGLDGTGTDEEAVSWGVAQARRSGTALHLLRVLDDGACPEERWGTLHRERRRAHRLATVHDPVPCLEVEVVFGGAVPLLVAASREAHLLVLGDSRVREAPDHRDEQVAVRVAADAGCPVVVVRRRGDGAVLARHGSVHPGVVVGVGPDATSSLPAALELGVEQAVERRCALTVVHLWPLDREAWWAADAARGARERRVADALQRALRGHPDLSVETVTARTDPVDALVTHAHARGAQLVVLPCGVDRRGVAPLPDPLVRQVLESARCSVAIVSGGVGDRTGDGVVRPPPAPAAGVSAWWGPSVPASAVVVALDGGPADHGAVRWGAAQALATRRRLHLVHVVHDGVPVVADAAGVVVVPPSEVLAGAAGAARERARALADELAPGAGVSVVTGHTVALLVAASRGAHLLVLGDTRLRTAPDHVGEQVAVFLTMRARCPVVVVPSDEAVGGERRADRARLAELVRRREVVVGLDGTHAATGALELAFAHASAHGCDLRVVHAWPPRTPSRPDPDPGWTDRRAMVSELLAGYRERFPGVLVVVDLVRGDPVAALLGRGRDWQAELLVLGGCCGQGPRRLPGAVTLGVLGRAGCPVATVRDDGVGQHLRHRAEPTSAHRGAHDGAAVLTGT